MTKFNLGKCILQSPKWLTIVVKQIVKIHGRLVLNNQLSIPFLAKFWSDDLMSMAEDWVKQCRFESMEKPSPDSPYSDVGQLIHAYNGTFDPLPYVRSWYDHRTNYSYATGKCTDLHCGYYKQVSVKQDICMRL